MLDATRAADVERIATQGRNDPACASLPASGRQELRSYCPLGSRWFVVLTKPNAEQWAEANLQRVGYETYLPMALARGLIVPLFSRYLFARYDAQPMHPICGTPGVQTLLRNSTGPQYARAGDISLLQAGEAARRCPPPGTGRKRPGDALRFAHGPFQGMECVVRSVGRKTADVSCIVMGAFRNVTAPLEWLSERCY